MRISATVLGLVGGVSGLLAALLAPGSHGTVTILGFGWPAPGVCLLGLLGAGVAVAIPEAGAVLLLIAGLGFLGSAS